MYQIALVIFREFLEIGILFGVFAAAINQMSGSWYYIVSGLMLGFLGASILGFFTTQIARSFGGFGDEYFDVMIIMTTVVMVVSTIAWMHKNSYRIRDNIMFKADLASEDRWQRIVFTLMIASTVFREGAEIILLLHSIVSTSNAEATEYILGFGLGAIGGIISSVAMYFGMFKIAARKIFSVSTILMTFIAAGLSAEAAKILVSVGAIDVLNIPLWDTSDIISDGSIIGKILKVVVGYHSRPCGIEIVFYAVTILVSCALTKFFDSKNHLNHI
jgi:high-affinity iron transporter